MKIKEKLKQNNIKLGNNWRHTIVCGQLNYNFMIDMCYKISPKINIIKNFSTQSKMLIRVLKDHRLYQQILPCD